MKSIPLYVQIIVCMVAGMLVGIFAPEAAKRIDWIGAIFMNALGMLIVPIIFFSIARSVAGIGGGGSLKRISLKTIGSAGIPMSAMVMLSIILSTVGLPIEGIGLVIGVDRILVAKSEKESLSIDI